jgi:hypothetical protein
LMKMSSKWSSESCNNTLDSRAHPYGRSENRDLS